MAEPFLPERVSSLVCLVGRAVLHIGRDGVSTTRRFTKTAAAVQLNLLSCSVWQPKRSQGMHVNFRGGFKTVKLSDPDQKQLDLALVLVRDVLDADVVGAYLFGSAVLGGLRPDSDLDIFVVSRRSMTLAEKPRLFQELMARSGMITPHGTLRRIELTIVVEQNVKPWKYPPNLDFQYGDWLREDFERDNAQLWLTASKPDLALLVSMVLLADTPVIGPRPSEVLDPVPEQHLVHAMLHDLERLRGDMAWDTRNVILTLARMWSTVATNRIRSKDAAASWALARLPRPHRDVLSRARALYLGGSAERWDDIQPGIAPCVDYMVDEIRNYRIEP